MSLRYSILRDSVSDCGEIVSQIPDNEAESSSENGRGDRFLGKELRGKQV